MSLRRFALWGLLPLGIVSVLGVVSDGKVAQAAPPVTSDIAPPPAHVKLPKGVRQRLDGSYIKRLCTRCNAFFVLPHDWQPGMPIPERATPQATSGPMVPSDVQTAYGLPASGGDGQIVAIIDAPDSHALTDVNQYRTTYGITSLARCTGLPTGSGTPCFAQVAEDGSPSTGGDTTDGSDYETSLDMDMISAACPDCSILLVEIQTNPLVGFCTSDIFEGVQTAVKLGASATSISIGGPEATDPNILAFDAGPQPEDAGPGPCPAEDPWPNLDPPGPYSQPGHLVFAASGDFGWDEVNNAQWGSETEGLASPSYPASDEYVISVGGTALYAGQSTSTTYGEGVWDDGRFGLDTGQGLTTRNQDVTTSGCSTEFAMPPWQQTPLSGTGCAMRATADVSAAATFFRTQTDEAAIAIYEGGSATSVVGTSASSPLVAAIYTLLGLTTEASNDLSWTYDNISAFNDVGSAGYALPTGGKTTDAPSGASCGKLCNAGTGWDGPTGVGSPNGTKLAALPKSTTTAPYPDAGFSYPVNLDAGISSSSSSSSGGVASSSGGSSSGSTEDSGATSSSGGSSSGPIGTGSGTTSGGSSSGTSSSEDAGSSSGPSSGGGGGSGGCSVVADGGTTGITFLGSILGLAALGARRRRSRN